MISNKLMTLLETFNKYELNRLRKFIQSPFFNENEDLLRLFDVLDSFFRNEKEDIEQEYVWKKIYGKKKYDDVRFRRLCSDLNKLTQEYLAMTEFRDHPLAPNAYMLRLLNTRGLDKHFLSVMRVIEKTRDRTELRDASFYYYNNLIEYEQHMYLEKADVMRTKKVNLESADFQLDCYYLSQKLKNYCDAINYKNILNIDINILLIETLLEEIKDSPFIKVPAVSIYYQILLTLTDRENTEHFYLLKDLLKDNSNHFRQQEMRNMYIFAQNYCIKKINTGHPTFYRSLFEIYQTLIQTEIILNKNMIVPWDYKNITSVGLRVGEYNWVEKFIKNYNQHLPKDYQKNALTYNLAMLHFYKKEYDKVIELLRDMTYKDVFDALQGRWLLLKTYYELDEFDALDALMDSFRIFLRRNKSISKGYQKMYLNAIRFIQKIMKIPYESKGAAEKLQQQIQECNPITERSWLLKKLSEVS